MKKTCIPRVWAWAIAATVVLYFAYGFLSGSGGSRVMGADSADRFKIEGRVFPYAIAEVRSHTSGIISQTLFTEGADVNKGDPLFLLDATLYETELLTAKARLADAEAGNSLAKTRFERSQRRRDANDIIQLDLDEAKAAMEKAAAELAVALADLKTAEFNLEQTKIRAPIEGRVGKALVTSGTLVTREQANPLAVVLQIDPIYVEFEQPLEWMQQLADVMQVDSLRDTGDTLITANLTLANGSQYQEKGKVLFSQATINDATGIVSFKAVFPNTSQILVPAMAVTCHFERKTDMTL